MWLPDRSNSSSQGEASQHPLNDRLSVSRHPFLRYAAEFWMIHLRDAGNNIEKVLSCVNELIRFDKPNNKKWWMYYCREIANLPLPALGIAEEVLIARFDLINILERSRISMPIKKRDSSS